MDAALRVLDAAGIHGLSMRRVAAELRTGAASLYWHVQNKDQLLQLIFERVTRQASLPEPDPSRWEDQLRSHAIRTRAILGSHRDLGQISPGHIPPGPILAIHTEWLFTLLTPAGIPDQVIARLGNLFALYAAASAVRESRGTASCTGDDPPAGQPAAMLTGYLLSLPEGRFPHTRTAADLLATGDPGERYTFGIDLILRGLGTYTKQPPG